MHYLMHYAMPYVTHYAMPYVTHYVMLYVMPYVMQVPEIAEALARGIKAAGGERVSVCFKGMHEQVHPFGGAR